MLSMQTVISQLRTEGYLNNEVTDSELETLLAPDPNTIPWYIRGAVGLSGWIAALFIVGFVIVGLGTMYKFTESALILVLIGTGLCMAMTAVKRYWLESIFIGQTSLAINLAGQLLIIVGVGAETEEIIATAIATIVLQVIMIQIYPDPIQRFLSVLMIVGALFVLMEEWKFYEAIHLLVIILATISLIIWAVDSKFVSRNLDAISRPIGFGTVVALFGLLIISTLEDSHVVYWWFSTSGLLLLLLGLMAYITHHAEFELPQSMLIGLVGGTVLLTLLTAQAPGIMAACLIVILAFWRGDTILMGVAIAFLTLFISAFYYNLNLTLLQKSLMLLASGGVCLGLRYFLKSTANEN